jgi:LysM repeat protein
MQELGKDLNGRMEQLERLVNQLGNDVAVVRKRVGRKPAAVESLPEKRAPQYHRVRKGESLYRIGRKYGVSIRELCRLNNISSNRAIHPGQKLIVGFSSSSPTPEHTSR